MAAKGKKWSLLQHWRQASNAKRLGWIVGICVAIATPGISIWDHYQKDDQFNLEHRPRVILNRVPEPRGSFTCLVAGKEMKRQFSETYISFKNIKNGDAITVIPIHQHQLLPVRKTGIPFFDELPHITNKSCGLMLRPNSDDLQPFPLNAGEEHFIDESNAAGVTTLTSNEYPNPVLTKEDRFIRFDTFCALYSDEQNNQHATCKTYKYIPANNQESFLCDGSPMMGSFQESLFGNCEN